jgi:hypothetical protein
MGWLAVVAIETEVRKDLSVRLHECHECGYEVDRDIASAQEICNRGQEAVRPRVMRSGILKDRRKTFTLEWGQGNAHQDNVSRDSGKARNCLSSRTVGGYVPI